MWVAVVLGALIALVVWYFFSKMFYEIAVMKGFPDKKYLWLTFIFGIIGAVLVAALPDRGNKNARLSEDKAMPSKQLENKNITQIEKEIKEIDVNQLSDEQIEQIQQYLSKDEKYNAAKRLCEITGVSINQAIDAIDKYIAVKDV